MPVSGGRVSTAEAGRPVVRPGVLVDPASDVDGLGDAVHAVAGVLVVVPLDPALPVFGLVDRDPVPDFGLAVGPGGPPFLLDAGVGEAHIDGVVQVQPLAVPGRDDRLSGDVSV